MAHRNIVQTCLVFLILVIVSTLAIPIDSNEPSNATEVSESREDMLARYRLPNNTIPHLYKICIEPNMDDENLTWVGEISIDIEVYQATSILTLHAGPDLVINENYTKLVDANGAKVKPITQTRDDELDFLKLRFEPEISVGNYSLDLAFEGQNAHHDDGFFKASFKHPKKLSVAATSFEPTSARRVFPCWDEPSLKAHFRMSIKHFPNYTAISNMPEIENVATHDGKTLTTFGTTPTMSTYLLNFVVADYGNISNEYGNVTVWARREVLEQARHMLNHSAKVVEVMEKYTGVPFGFPRIGSVLLPLYSSTAIEHWGLVSYTESDMKFDENSASFMVEDRINLLIAHELAHTWFGNHVSPAWWDDLWLNEAFSEYFQFLIVNEVFENWRGEELFVLQNNYIMFGLERAITQPVKCTAVTRTEIEGLFGASTYVKGGAVVHMFRKVLTDDIFRAGLQKYLAKHSLGSVSSDDLMRSLQEAYDESIYAETPLNVKETMESWLTQMGYPIVNVTRDYTTGLTRVAQESATIRENITTKWWVPLSYATQSNHNFSSTAPSTWISDKEDSVTIDVINKDDWVIFNIQSSGYYRVIYDEENWNRIADYLNTDNYENIHVLNRAQLLNDALFMTRSDPDRYYRILHNLTKYMSRETDAFPWIVAKGALRRIDESLDGTEVYDIFLRYALGLMEAFIEKVGFEKRESDDHLTKLARLEFVPWTCSSGHSGCTDYAAKKLIQVVENGTYHRLDPDTAGSIYCTGLRALNDTKAKEVVAWAFEHKTELATNNLGCTKNHDIHREYLMGNKTGHSKDDVWAMAKILGSIMKGSEENFNFAIDFFLANHEAMNNVESPEKRVEALGNAVQRIADYVKTAARLEKFREVLQLDAVIKAIKMDAKSILDIIEKSLAKKNSNAAKFREIWHE